MPHQHKSLKLCAHCGKRVPHAMRQHSPCGKRFWLCSSCFVDTQFDMAQKLIMFCYGIPLPEAGVPGFLRKLLKGLKADG